MLQLLSRVERRFLVVLRAPARELRNLLPTGLDPIERRSIGFVLLDYACTCPLRLGPLQLGQGVDRLSWKVPVSGKIGAEVRRGLWIARRWTSAGQISRWTETRLAEQRRLSQAFGVGVEPSRPGHFLYREEGLHVELDVRSHNGPNSVRTAYLRTETYGELAGSVFANTHAAEEELQSWGDCFASAHPSSEIETTRFATGHLGLQPLAVHALQTASLPELLPGIEKLIELDSAFRVVRRRMQPVRKRLETWKNLSRGPLPIPPEGAFSVRSR